MGVVYVKTRKSNYFGEPESFVNKQKKRIQAANAYVARNQLDMKVRFGIVSVIISDTGIKIDHIEDAFYPLL